MIFCTDLFNGEYKPLLYIDSMECADCRFHLDERKNIMQDINSYTTNSGDLFVFFYPKSKSLQFNFLTFVFLVFKSVQDSWKSILQITLRFQRIVEHYD